MSVDPSVPAAVRPDHARRIVTWLVLVLLATSAPLGVAAQAADVDFRRDPSAVFVVVALLMGAAAMGLAFPIAGGLRKKHLPPPAKRVGPSRGEGEDDLPWMPGGDIFGSAADDGADRGS